MKESDYIHLPPHLWPDLCSEYSSNPIELEIKIRKAEKDGWERVDFPYKHKGYFGGRNDGDYVQLLGRWPNKSKKL